MNFYLIDYFLYYYYVYLDIPKWLDVLIFHLHTIRVEKYENEKREREKKCIYICI